MNTLDLVNEMASWGHQVRPEVIHKFHRYLSGMLLRERVIFVESDKLEAVIFFFLTDDITHFANKPTWAAPPDTDSGHILFIDKMLCRKWSRDIREAIRNQVEMKYPQIESAHWLRSPKNRHVILKRRGLVYGI